MDVSIAHEDDAVVASVRGEIDADNCEGLGERLLEDTSDVSRLVVDLSGLTFIDSSGISELLRTSETADERGQQFEIRNPSTTVYRVLEITGLLSHFGLT